MCYEINPALLKDEAKATMKKNERNAWFSPLDKILAREAYPVLLETFPIKSRVRVKLDEVIVRRQFSVVQRLDY
jgi:hypothetical protein